MNTNEFTITVQPAGWTFTAQDGQSLLAAAEAAGIVLPSSCRNGTCRTCLCGTLGEQGEGARSGVHKGAAPVDYLVAWPGVSLDEKLAGDVLPCVAVARADLVLLVPAARRT